MTSKLNTATLLSILVLSLIGGSVSLSDGQKNGMGKRIPIAKGVYRNPIEVPTNGREIADPSVYKYKDRYYLISTQEYPHGGDGFRVWVSTDLVDWKFHRSVPIKGKLNPMMAPDLAYHEGTYYLYWSVDDPNHDPKGIHYGAKYTPKGVDFDPFGPDTRYEIFTYDFLHTKRHNIDGEIFFDRNDIYMFFCGHGGIRYKQLQSLGDSGDGPVHQLTSCVVDGIDIKPGEPGNNGWTEAPAIFLLDGYYHMTYSGVHFLRNDYQIHSARGRSIESIKPYKPNPLIIHTEGDVNGMGNNNWIMGPDLKTRYTTYHAKLGEGVFNPATQTGFMRKLMLDRYEVAPEDGIITAAPTLTNQPVPDPVGWSADLASVPSNMAFAAEGKAGITALDGAVKISTTKSGIGRLLAKKPSAADFVVEGHVKGTGLWRESPPSRIGITAAGGTIKLALGFPTNPADSTTPATLQYYIEGKGWTDTGIKDVKFFHAWHKLKIDKNGNTVRFYYDDRFVEEDVIYSSDGGKLGYFVENAEADLSWIGFSNY
ncbi:MAG: hypothetical protein DRP64_03550 [Verrucomicrobia bacterium]|nr:MAG: hypothetical protein DRP64_03550 [Verrucomicrobiota bacterium]